MKKVGQVHDANFPKDADGRVYHLGLKEGELANRILMVGDPFRAQLITSLLDMDTNRFYHNSNRGFTTYTGAYNGEPVSIMAIGMGLAMMDFAVRESRAIINGPLSIIRLGTCGTINKSVSIGTIIAAQSSFLVRVNHDAYLKTGSEKFSFSLPVGSSQGLHAQLFEQLIKEIPQPYSVISTVDATADSFYSSQGRIDVNFDDDNEELLERIRQYNSDVSSLQMETYQLFHLAQLCTTEINVAACAIAIAQRVSNEFLALEELKKLELCAGKACLNALVDNNIS